MFRDNAKRTQEKWITGDWMTGVMTIMSVFRNSCTVELVVSVGDNLLFGRWMTRTIMTLNFILDKMENNLGFGGIAGQKKKKRRK